MKRSNLFTILALAAAVIPVGTNTAFAQKTVAPVQTPPSNVLVFPPSLPGATPDAKGDYNRNAKKAQDIITDSIKMRMSKAGVGALVYNTRMPSVQRAISENTVTAANAANPIGDGTDDRVVQNVATVLGADEFVVVEVSNYKYDDKTHTATFDISLSRKAIDGTSLGVVAEKAVGAAPDDVAANLQEGSAVARAAEVVADQVVNALYPMPKVETKKK